MQRYTLKAALGLSASEDDDGRAFSNASGVISDEQHEELRNLISATDTDIGKFLQFARAESLSDVEAKDFPRLKSMLMKKKREAGE